MLKAAHRPASAAVTILTGILVGVLLATFPVVAVAALPGKARLILVFILDGLRPEAINAEPLPTSPGRR